MTKLLEWLMGLGLFMGIWSAFVTRSLSHPLLEAYWPLVIYFPVFAIGLFGVSDGK